MKLVVNKQGREWDSEFDVAANTVGIQHYCGITTQYSFSVVSSDGVALFGRSVPGGMPVVRIVLNRWSR